MLLQVEKAQRPQLRALLEDLMMEGKIEVSRHGKYRKAQSKALVGTFIAHPKGFGFVEIEGRGRGCVYSGVGGSRRIP